MKEEEISGPKELIEMSKERDIDDKNDDVCITCLKKDYVYSNITF